MFREPSAVSVGHGDPFALAARPVELPGDRLPHEAGGGVARLGGLAATAADATNKVRPGRARQPEQYGGRGTVPGDVRAGCVDHVSEVDGREKLLDEQAAELTLHEAVGHEHADETGSVAGGACQTEEPNDKRDRQRVPAAAHRIDRAVQLILCSIPYRDVRGIADDGVVTPGAQQVDSGGRITTEVLVDAMCHGVMWDQGVARRDYERQLRDLRQAAGPCRRDRGYEKTEAADNGGERVLVDSMDGREHLPDLMPRAGVRCRSVPSL